MREQEEGWSKGERGGKEKWKRIEMEKRWGWGEGTRRTSCYRKTFCKIDTPKNNILLRGSDRKRNLTLIVINIHRRLQC